MLTAVIPQHSLAVWLVSNIDRLLDWAGLGREPELEEVVYVIIIVALAMFIGWAIKAIVLAGARKFVSLKRTAFVQEILDQRILSKCSRVIPPLVILGLLPFAFETDSFLLRLFERFLVVYVIVVATLAMSGIMTFVWLRYDRRENAKNLPLKGILNSAKGVLWIISGIVAVSILVDKSPTVLLTGLGAFAAALMLIFKDSILGFVSGIQLSQNDMLRVGDWIVVPSTVANGIVTDVSLTAVKVRNWDNTIVTLPPYTLVSTSFQNWRGMSESGMRQIVRSVIVVTTSIRQADDAYLDRVAGRLPSLKKFIDARRAAGGKPVFDPANAAVNGTIDTNLGLMRAYLCDYLINDPMISNYQIIVRTLQPTSTGTPLQLWCYVATTQWVAYEAVQSAIFEHIAVVAPMFELELFNYMSDNDPDVVQVQNIGPAAPTAQPTA